MPQFQNCQKPKNMIEKYHQFTNHIFLLFIPMQAASSLRMSMTSEFLTLESLTFAKKMFSLVLSQEKYRHVKAQLRQSQPKEWLQLQVVSTAKASFYI